MSPSGTDFKPLNLYVNYNLIRKIFSGCDSVFMGSFSCLLYTLYLSSVITLSQFTKISIMSPSKFGLWIRLGWWYSQICCIHHMPYGIMEFIGQVHFYAEKISPFM